MRRRATWQTASVLAVCAALSGGCTGGGGEECIAAFAEDTVLDLNLQTASVTITVELDGEALPDTSGGRGHVRLSREGSESLDIPLAPTGPAIAAAEVFTGSYRIEWIGERDQDILPRQNVVLADELVIEEPVDQRFELESAGATGSVTLNGASLPASASPRGALQFRRADNGHVLEVDLGSSGEGQYDARLLAGVYDVSIDGDAAGDVFPTQNALLASGVEIRGESARDFDVRVVEISGELKQDGSAVPSNTTSSSRGELVFSGKDLGEEVADLAIAGPALYQVKLFAGEYQVALRPGKGLAQTVFPVVSTRVADNLSLTQNQTRDFDVRTARLHGEVTIDGMPLADNPLGGERGRLRFVPRGGGLGLSVALAPGGPGRFDVTLFEGTYDVSLAPHPSDQQSVLPEHEVLLAGDVQVAGDEQLDLGANTVTVSGEVSVDGAAMAPNLISVSPRGSVRFEGAGGGGRVEASIGSSGAARFDVRLFAGTYDVVLVADEATNQDAIPAQQIDLAHDVTIDRDSQLAYDVTTVHITGEVTLDGNALPDASSDRGTVAFVSPTARGEITAPLGSVGPAMYSVRLIAAAYDVLVVGAAPLLPEQSIRRIQGCHADLGSDDDDPGVDFDEDGDGDEDEDGPDISGVWTLTAAQAIWGTWTFDFQQSGELVDGTFSHPVGGMGSIEEGSFVDGELSFALRTGFGCKIEFRGQLIGDCELSGVLQDVTCPNTVPTSDWTAVCE